jgi:hypothetical protein
MKKKVMHFKGRSTATGLSMIELALVLPVLLLLLLGVADFGRFILFDNILINMSREGANLAARTSQSPQFIIDALNHTATPLDMEAHGMVFITRVVGADGGGGTVVSRVEDQYRSSVGDASLQSRLSWSCPSWTAAKCNVPVAQADRLVVLSLPRPMALGEEVHVVETIYHYSMFTKYVLQSDPDLYSFTLL